MTDARIEERIERLEQAITRCGYTQATVRNYCGAVRAFLLKQIRSPLADIGM